MLRIALPNKGRLAEDVRGVFADAGLVETGEDDDGRYVRFLPVAGLEPTREAISHPVLRPRRSRRISSATLGWVWRGDQWGRELRSISAASPASQ